MKLSYNDFITGARWCILILMIAMVGYSLQGNPEAKEKAKLLKIELNTINPLPYTEVVNRVEITKIDTSLVSYHFSGSTSYSQLRNYFDEELGRNGWTFVSDRKYTADGKDWGGKIATYKKGEFTLNVAYNGSFRPSYDYGSYSIGVSWEKEGAGIIGWIKLKIGSAFSVVDKN